MISDEIRGLTEKFKALKNKIGTAVGEVQGPTADFL